MQSIFIMLIVSVCRVYSSCWLSLYAEYIPPVDYLCMQSIFRLLIVSVRREYSLCRLSLYAEYIPHVDCLCMQSIFLLLIVSVCRVIHPVDCLCKPSIFLLSINSLCKQSIHFKDWGRIKVGLSEHLYAPEIVSRLNQPGACLNSQVMTMDIGSEAA